MQTQIKNIKNACYITVSSPLEIHGAQQFRVWLTGCVFLPLYGNYTC